ncbi:MAG TPA: ABC transporter ATP-binding protein, partial [Firmicutes bacterium]|nr:ABC transporter ATP-binding protein [Bacillota bacterium]
MPSVICENLVKTFGQQKPVRALDGLSMSVNEGEIFGLLGPNGSGKTTFVKCCLNIIFPTSGSLSVLGRKPGHPKSSLETGYLPESPSFYTHLTGRQFLYYQAELSSVPFSERSRRIDDVLEMVNLNQNAVNRRLRTYSKGMLQRIGLAQALIGKPKLIFLDEPQSGLDPIGRRQVKDIMRKIADDGTTVLFSSHVLGDVEDVADRVAIIDRGKLRRIAPLDELTIPTNSVKIQLVSPSSRKSETDEQLDRSLINRLSEIGASGIEFSNGILSCTV